MAELVVRGECNSSSASTSCFMSLQGSGNTSTNHNDVDDNLYYNPFALSSQSSFSSAVKPKDGSIGTRPMYRRRGSEGSSAAKRVRTDHDPWQDGHAVSGLAHVRSRTLDGVAGSSSGAKFHPLAPSKNLAPGATSSRSSMTDTRPRLKRLLSDLEPALSRKGNPSEGLVEEVDTTRPSKLSATPRERVVIVHEVTQKDSLAGVALKYGISLAELRRANQLWTSDPIHLRKVLYIPLDKSDKAKELVLTQLELSNTPTTSPDLDASLGSSLARDDHSDPSTLITSSSSTQLTIRRVPVSQLSFFPPASTSSLHPSHSRTLPHTTTSARKRDPIPFETTASSSSTHSASTSSSLPSTSAFASALQIPPSPTPPRAPPMPTLTSLFGALPLGRISFDSGASTPSQASEDQEHEMGDVSRFSPALEGRQRTPARNNSDYVGTFGPRTPSKQSKVPDGVELSPFLSSDTLSNSSKRVEGAKLSPRNRTMHYTSPDRPVGIPEIVRTSQPQPSPTMQLPLKSRRDPRG